MVAQNYLMSRQFELRLLTRMSKSITDPHELEVFLKAIGMLATMPGMLATSITKLINSLLP